MHYMGVDIGTTGCKAVVFDKNGRALGGDYRPYPLLTPRPGWAELDSERVIRDCLAVIGNAARQAGPAVGIGISSQGEAFTPVDAGGAYLGHAMVSSDIRAADVTQEWSHDFGRQRLYEITGHTPHPMFSLFKLAWMKTHAPDIWRRTAKFLCYEDLLAAAMGVEPAMGRPLAGRTMLFDIRQNAWSNEILEALDLDAARLARTLPAGTAAGIIPASITRRMQLAPDALLVAGGHDQVCAALGADAGHPGRASYATGTVECICPAFDRPVIDTRLYQNNLCTYAHAAAGLYATVAFSLTGGNLLQWFRDEFGAREKERAGRDGLDAYTLLLESMPDKPTSLQVLPYFAPGGTPYFDTHTRGAVMGLTLSTRRNEILKALLEGVALEMRLNLDILAQAGIRVDELRATGGGARSRVWTQLKADVLDKPITTVDVAEAGCLGAAALACAAHTGVPAAEVAARWTRTNAVINPRPEHAAVYAAKFAAYRQLYPRLKVCRPDAAAHADDQESKQGE